MPIVSRIGARGSSDQRRGSRCFSQWLNTQQTRAHSGVCFGGTPGAAPPDCRVPCSAGPSGCPATVPRMTEQQPYDVIETFDAFELRRYPQHVVAQVQVSGTFDSAGNSAFAPLFGYITGENESRDSIEMTAPVVQQRATPDTAPKSVSMAMTSPVTQTQAGDGRYVVAFVLPVTMTAENAPIPTNPAVSIRVVPERLAGAVTYSGRGAASAYDKHLGELLAGLAAAGLTPKGAPSSARFDAPSKPWFLRRNEVVQPVEAPDAG